MSTSEEAASRFLEGSLCSQAILATYAPRLGLDPETACKIATPFGSGMAGLGQICGAVTGAFMVIGLKYGNCSNWLRKDRGIENSYRLVREFVNEFTSLHGSILCRDILGCNLNTTEGRKTASEQGVFRALCPNFIRNAAVVLERLII